MSGPLQQISKPLGSSLVSRHPDSPSLLADAHYLVGPSGKHRPKPSPFSCQWWADEIEELVHLHTSVGWIHPSQPNMKEVLFYILLFKNAVKAFPLFMLFPWKISSNFIVWWEDSTIEERCSYFSCDHILLREKKKIWTNVHIEDFDFPWGHSFLLSS